MLPSNQVLSSIWPIMWDSEIIIIIIIDNEDPKKSSKYGGLMWMQWILYWWLQGGMWSRSGPHTRWNDGTSVRSCWPDLSHKQATCQQRVKQIRSWFVPVPVWVLSGLECHFSELYMGQMNISGNYLQSWMESVRKRPTKTCILTKQNAGENMKPKVKYKLWDLLHLSCRQHLWLQNRTEHLVGNFRLFLTARWEKRGK